MKIRIIGLLFLCITSITQAQKSYQLIPFKKGELWGYSDTSGNLIIQPEYDSVALFAQNLGKVQKNDLIGYIDVKGETVIPCSYEHCYPIANNHFAVLKGDKFGIIDTLEKVLLPYKYDNLKAFSPQFTRFRKAEKIGVLYWNNNQYKTLIEPIYSKISYSSYDKQFVCLDSDQKRILLSFQKDSVVQVPDEVMEAFSIDYDESDFSSSKSFPNFKEYKVKGKTGLIKFSRKYQKNRGARIVADTLPSLYGSIVPVKHHEYFLIKKKKKWGAMNYKGDVILAPKYQEINTTLSSLNSFNPYKERFYVKQKGQWGLIGNRSKNDSIIEFNKVLIPIKYDEISELFRDYVTLKKNNKIGLFSIRSFKTITPIKYNRVVLKWIRNDSGINLFIVETTTGEFIFVGSNGVEFYSPN